MTDYDLSAPHTKREDAKLVWRSLKLTQRLVPMAIPTIISLSLVDALSPFANVFLTAQLLDELMGARSQSRLSLLVTVIVALNLGFALLNRSLNRVRSLQANVLESRFRQAVADKSANMDYLHAENPLTQELRVFFEEGQNSRGGLGSYLRIFGLALQDTVTIGVSLGIVWQLFFLPGSGLHSGLLAFIDSPAAIFALLALMLLAVILAALINLRTGQLQFKVNEVNIPANRKFNYLAENVLNDYQFGKDIRLYHMAPMIERELDDFSNISLSNFRRLI
ncbi:MAG: hypothetical protein FWF06_08210, partial [Symbiobacteriaceae bacterium]|nr:hypothetical protein [Symbiobacteriaceae bacterium]